MPSKRTSPATSASPSPTARAAPAPTGDDAALALGARSGSTITEACSDAGAALEPHPSAPSDASALRATSARADGASDHGTTRAKGSTTRRA